MIDVEKKKYICLKKLMKEIQIHPALFRNERRQTIGFFIRLVLVPVMEPDGDRTMSGVEFQYIAMQRNLTKSRSNGRFVVGGHLYLIAPGTASPDHASFDFLAYFTF
jgi:hypothetical protein